MTQSIQLLQNSIAEKQSEIEKLKNELVQEIKNMISSNIEVNVTDWCTYIATISNEKRNQFTIYHDSHFTENRRYEVSWFASTLNLNDDKYDYSEYLIVLGRLS